MALAMRWMIIGCAIALASASLPKLKDLPYNQFTRIEMGGDTQCGDGSPFYIYVKRGDKRRVLIDFEGGGGCFDYDTCFAGNFGIRNGNANGEYEQELHGSIGQSDDFPANIPPSFAGPPTTPEDFNRFAERALLFNPDLPTISWTMVYVPYCTQDFHLGTSNTSYTGVNPETGEVETRWLFHNGKANRGAAVNWVKDNFKRGKTKEVLTSGCSAGTGGVSVAATDLEKFYYPHDDSDDDDKHGGSDSEHSDDSESDTDHPVLSAFMDSFFGVSSPIGQIANFNWGADCEILRIMSPLYDPTDPEFWVDSDGSNGHLTLELFWEAAIRRNSRTKFMLYGAMEDFVAQIAYANPNFGTDDFPLVAYPADGYQNRFRTLMDRIDALPNAVVYAVNAFTFDAAALQADPTLLLGNVHCAAGAGSFFFTFLARDTHQFYSTIDYDGWSSRIGIALAPWYGYNPYLDPAGAPPDAVAWFTAGVEARDMGDLPGSYVAPQVAATADNGCDPSSGEFKTYNNCGLCETSATQCLAPLETFTLAPPFFDLASFVGQFVGNWAMTGFTSKNSLSLANEFILFTQLQECPAEEPRRRRRGRGWSRRKAAIGCGAAAGAALILTLVGRRHMRKRRQLTTSAIHVATSPTPVAVFGQHKQVERVQSYAEDV